VHVAREPIVGLYTRDAAVAAAALPLLAWVTVFHTADAVQIIASFLLRAYRVATLPVLIYAGSLWGIGLGGGYVLGFDVAGTSAWLPAGARGYWVASTTGLVVAALGLLALWWRVQRRATPA
jgi:MATE family multidrug resistance protein